MKNLPPIPMAKPASEHEEPCCGPPLQAAGSPFERPGYEICGFVDDFIDTPVGPVPVVASRLNLRDYLGRTRARAGIRRDQYKVAPGLYAVGKPGQDSPVLVTANYKLSFDSLRQELAGIEAWILVLDSRGVNVWCAASKKTFCTDELVYRVKRAGLEKVVSHRRLILPQLGATGVAAFKVKKGCGFEVIWGPIRAADIKAFLDNDKKTTPTMREVTFSFKERMVLSPVEMALFLKPSLYILVALFFISGIGRDFFSFDRAWLRWLGLVPGYFMGVVSGAVLAPGLLPWLPASRFYMKGLLTGLLTLPAFVIYLVNRSFSDPEVAAVLLIGLTVSSYLAMNFTGATPFTSPTGVEKEMRQAIPVQIVMALAALILWVAAPFLR